MITIVVDAGPLIHLRQIDRLEILKHFPRIYIPEIVLNETSRGPNKIAVTIKNWPNVILEKEPERIHDPIRNSCIKAGLHPGETACICLAARMVRCVFLTDDLAARKLANQLHLEVHGTVGIIAYAFRMKWFSLRDAENALRSLTVQSSLFVTPLIIENAIHTLRKHS